MCMRAYRRLYSAEPVWEEPEDLRTMLDESTFEVTEDMVRLSHTLTRRRCTGLLLPSASGPDAGPGGSVAG